MSKCRYDLSEDCNNKDCVRCVLDKVRAEIEQLSIYNNFTYENYLASEFKYDVLDVIDKYKAETEDT